MQSKLNNDLSLTLHKDLVVEMSKLSPSAIINLSKVSKHYSTLCSRTNELPHALNCLRNLLKHAALGEWKQAKAIVKLYPDLLTCKGTVYFPNNTKLNSQTVVMIPEYLHPGRYKYANCTAWQIALMNEEWDVAISLSNYMDENEKRNQFFEVFPECDVKCRLYLADAKILLQALFDTLVLDKCVMNRETYELMNKLYTYVKPMPEQKKGLVFDTNIYIAALELYQKNVSSFQNEKQRIFWCIRVEEYLASLLGTSYLRVRAQGFPKKADMALGCVIQDGSIHPFRRNFDSIPGCHFFVGLSGGTLIKAGRGEILNTRINLYKYLCLEQEDTQKEFVKEFKPHYQFRM